MTQMIEVTISPQGETKVETKGFAGPTCKEASRALEAALGASQSEQLTSEFYQPAAATDELRQSE